MFFPFKKNYKIQKQFNSTSKLKQNSNPELKDFNKSNKLIGSYEMNSLAIINSKGYSIQAFSKYMLDRPRYQSKQIKTVLSKDPQKLKNNINSYNTCECIFSEKRITDKNNNDVKQEINLERYLKKNQSPNVKLKKISRLNMNKLKNQNKKPINNQQKLNNTKSTTISFYGSENMIMQTDISQKYQILDILGKGAYGVVKKCQQRSTKKIFAIKEFFMNKHNQIKLRMNIQRQIKILNKLNHPHIMKYKDCIFSEKNISLIMEYCGDINLKRYIKQNKKIEEKQAKMIFFNILRGIQYMHANNIIHRDIKLQNIMIDVPYDVKIIDFGFSFHLQNQKQLLNTYCGTPSYMSPEIIKKMPYNGYKADVWALGILLHRLVSGKYPYSTKQDKPVLQNVAKGDIRICDDLSYQLKILLRKMLEYKYQSRISISQIFKQNWLKQ